MQDHHITVARAAVCTARYADDVHFFELVCMAYMIQRGLSWSRSCQKAMHDPARQGYFDDQTTKARCNALMLEADLGFQHWPDLLQCAD